MLNTAAQERLEKLQSNLCRWALLSTMLISPKCCSIFLFFFKLYLFYNDYETSYTTYINHACWHRCLRSDDLCAGGNRNARRKPTCDHMAIAHANAGYRTWVASVRGECGYTVLVYVVYVHWLCVRFITWIQIYRCILTNTLLNLTYEMRPIQQDTYV